MRALMEHKSGHFFRANQEQPPSGSATVIFAIDQTGSLRYARISHSSDNPVLDDAALATVRNAAPFPPPPRALNADDLAYSIEIGFPGSSGRPPSRQ